MATVDNTVLNASLEECREAERVVICSSEPATYAAVAGVTLLVNASPVHGTTEDYAGGRQFTTAAASGLTATESGEGTHYAYVNDTNSILLAVQTVLSSPAMVSGSDYNIQAITIQQPGPV